VRPWPLLLVLGACDVVPYGDGPRRAAVHDVAEQVILPTQEEIEATAAALDEADTLDELRAAWRDARDPWMESEAFRIGPVKDQLIDSSIDQWPIDAVEIDAVLAGIEPIDEDAIDALGASKKGFHALEYLIFGADDLADPRRAAYAAELAADLAEHATTLRAAWTGGYFDAFVDVGAEGAAFETIKEAVDALINQAVFLTELIVDGKLVAPIEIAGSDAAIDDVAANLRGLRRIWEVGLRGLVDARSPGAALRLDAELDAADAAIAAVPRPFAGALDGPEAAAALAAVREVRLSFTVDVVAILGATLSFNDNDGD